MRSVLAFTLMVLWVTAASAQQGPSGTAPKSNDPKAAPPAPACERFAAAQSTVYAAYVRMIAAELPDPKIASGDPTALSTAFQALYQSYVDKARSGDMEGMRKAVALELFGMQLQKQPALEITQRKLCMMAKEPGRGAILDILGCAVTSLDGPRREQLGYKALARQMIDKATNLVPESANAADTGKILLDDVSRGLAGCY